MPMQMMIEKEKKKEKKEKKRPYDGPLLQSIYSAPIPS